MAGALTAAIAAAFAGGAAPPSTDDYFEYTTLLLPGNGTNGAQNNTFLDGSTNNFTITRNGNTTQGTFSPFSQTGWGNYFDGTGDYLTWAPGSGVAFGTSAFCVEMWFYPTGSIASLYLIDARNASQTSTWSFAFGYSGTSSRIEWANNGTVIANGGTTNVISNAWNHIVYCRSGTGANQASMFINGVRQANVTDSTNYSTSPTISYVGCRFSASDFLTGYLSNIRIVNGSQVYDPSLSTLTVPTAPLTAITNTSLLTCQSNRFIDNSTNNFTITRNGDTRVVAFSPFNPTASWSAATNGGSGYFDGSGDYLSVASTNTVVPTGTQDYAVEAWVYWGTQVTSYPQIISNPTTNGFQIVYDVASGFLAVGVFNVRNAITYAIAQSALANQWTHIVVTRSGNTHRMMVNGVLRANGTDSISFASPTTQAIGSAGAANYFVGYISGLRSVLGSIPTTYQTSSTTNGTVIFDPPATPVTTTSQGATSGDVELLLNFTNAGIYDATSKNDLETVGNAQVSTAQSKWGGSSISFDGTGDYLTSLNSTLYQFGTGDFAIEGWIYINSLSAAIALIDFRATNGATYGQIYITTGGVLRFYLPTDIGTSNSFSTGAWTFFAIARTAGTLNMYIGANRGYTGTYTSAMDGGALKIGADVNGGSGLNGYLQDLRFTKGYGRGYTGATITVPTAPFSVQ